MGSLTYRTIKVIRKIFPVEEQAKVRSVIIKECGNNLPFCNECSPEELDRIRLAALKISKGDLTVLESAIKQANTDWRDILVNAGFDDVNAHLAWANTFDETNEDCRKFLEALAVENFVLNCTNIIGQKLFDMGFVIHSSMFCHVDFLKSDILLSLSYWPESSPNYKMHMGIGFKNVIQDSDRFGSIGLWYSMPEDFDFADWAFKNEDELKRCLVSIRDNVIDQYAKPLWENTDKLIELIRKNRKEIEQRIEKDAIQRKRSAARKAFKSGDYKTAIKNFESLGENNFMPVDMKMYTISKKRYNKNAEFTAI